MKFLIILNSLIILAALNKCDQKETKKAVESKSNKTISYGTSFGMCKSGCNKTIEITGTKVIYKNLTQLNEVKDSVIGTITDEEWTKLVAAADYDILKKLPERIGCPDCFDQGAEWIAFSNNEDSKKITFEYGQKPNEIEPLVKQLQGIMKKFTKDDPNPRANDNEEKASTSTNSSIIDQSAVIKNYVCTRGCYQYVIDWNNNGKTVHLFDKNLSEKYKVDGMKIVFSGKLLNSTTTINKPAPNDVPIKDFDAQNVVIEKIETK